MSAPEGRGPEHGGPADELLFRSDEGGHEVVLLREPDGALALTIDGFWQFSSREEARFHAVLADAPMMLAPRRAEVLILGGGDGLALRHVLRYPEVTRVDLVDIDPAVIRMAREQPHMLALTERSLLDPRVHVHVEDALAWVARPGPGHDVVICDFPAPSLPELEPLFDDPFYAALAARSRPHTVVSIQVSQDLPEFWDTLASVARHFPATRALLLQLEATALDDEAWADFVLATCADFSEAHPAAGASPWLTPECLAKLEIQNRSGPRFLTQAYGDRPHFDVG